MPPLNFRTLVHSRQGPYNGVMRQLHSILKPPTHIVAVFGLIRDASRRVLVVRSPKRGWEMPGGQVEEGESLVQALQREIGEEAGVTVTVGKLVGVYSNVKPPTKVIFGFLYVCWWRPDHERGKP
jgi:8-oxo-dGTP pyrophosphatase MutT (NUDIX family)